MAPLTCEEAESMSLDAFLRLEGDEERCDPSSLQAVAKGCVAVFGVRVPESLLNDGSWGLAGRSRVGHA